MGSEPTFWYDQRVPCFYHIAELYGHLLIGTIAALAPDANSAVRAGIPHTAALRDRLRHRQRLSHQVEPGRVDVTVEIVHRGLRDINGVAVLHDLVKRRVALQELVYVDLSHDLLPVLISAAQNDI